MTAKASAFEPMMSGWIAVSDGSRCQGREAAASPSRKRVRNAPRWFRRWGSCRITSIAARKAAAIIAERPWRTCRCGPSA